MFIKIKNMNFSSNNIKIINNKIKYINNLDIFRINNNFLRNKKFGSIINTDLKYTLKTK
jgi:hypothetical protein